MPPPVLLLGATFCMVSLRACQQINVVRGHYALIPLVAALLALVDVYVIATVARSGPSLSTVCPVALGGTLGCWSAMLAHGVGRRSHAPDPDH